MSFQEIPLIVKLIPHLRHLFLQLKCEKSGIISSKYFLRSLQEDSPTSSTPLPPSPFTPKIQPPPSTNLGHWFPRTLVPQDISSVIPRIFGPQDIGSLRHWFPRMLVPQDIGSLGHWFPRSLVPQDISSLQHQFSRTIVLKDIGPPLKT